MSLTLHVVSINAQAPARPLAARFGEAGGSIGRGDDNLLVLPDPSRHVSRLQARIVHGDEGYELRDEGGNPSQLNGRPLVGGCAALLRDGDELRIGGYVLRVEIAASGATAADDRQRAAAALPDALAAWGDDDPFAQFDAPPPQAARTPAAAPDLLDIFGSAAADPNAAAAAAAAASALPNAFDIDGATPPLEALFGLDPGGAADPFAGGPLAAPVLSGGAPAPASLDPLAPYEMKPKTPAPRAALADRVPEIHGAFVPPQARPPLRVVGAPPLQQQSPQAGDVMPKLPPARRDIDVFLSWDDDPSSTRPDLYAAYVAEPPPELPPRLPPEPPLRATVAQPQPPPTAATTTTTTAHASLADIELALAQGLGLAALPAGGLSPALAHRLGLLLREATQGTLDLLGARARIKGGLRAEVTQIRAVDNNPLKFSPGIDAALAHLLAPTVRGFMAPEAALRDAFDDLRAHQFGFMAGLRAALAELLQRFEPAALARQLPAGALDGLLPGRRQARLWQLHEQLHRDIAAQAHEDFDALFGRAFVRAYEAQVARLAAALPGDPETAPSPGAPEAAPPAGDAEAAPPRGAAPPAAAARERR